MIDVPKYDNRSMKIQMKEAEDNVKYSGIRLEMAQERKERLAEQLMAAKRLVLKTSSDLV